MNTIAEIFNPMSTYYDASKTLHPMMTKEEFVGMYSSMGGTLVNNPDMQVVPCTCDDEYCTGWKFIPIELVI